MGVVRTLVPLLQLLLVKVCGLLQFGQLLLRELGLSVLRMSWSASLDDPTQIGSTDEEGWVMATMRPS